MEIVGVDLPNVLVGQLQLLMVDLKPVTAAIAEEKTDLFIAQAEPNFWSDRRAALSKVDRVQRLDRLLSPMNLVRRYDPAPGDVGWIPAG